MKWIEKDLIWPDNLFFMAQCTLTQSVDQSASPVSQRASILLLPRYFIVTCLKVREVIKKFVHVSSGEGNLFNNMSHLKMMFWRNFSKWLQLMCEDSELGKFVFNENHRYILHNERSKKKKMMFLIWIITWRQKGFLFSPRLSQYNTDYSEFADIALSALVMT